MKLSKVMKFFFFSPGAETLSNLETFDGNFETDSAANTALGTLEVRLCACVRVRVRL